MIEIIIELVHQSHFVVHCYILVHKTCNRYEIHRGITILLFGLLGLGETAKRGEVKMIKLTLRTQKGIYQICL